MRQRIGHDLVAKAARMQQELQNESRLEDALYLQVDKLLALCSVQAALASGDYTPTPATHTHYSLVMEEQALELRRLLDRVFV